MTAMPFAGLNVLDLAWVVAGPLVGRTLAEFGAEVVRVESSKRVETARLMGPFPDGVPNREQSVLYDNCNVGKYGLALDLTRPEAKAVAFDLAVWADVVIESFMPGQMEKFGLGYEAIRERNPDVIMLRSSLMGQSGPYSRFAGYGNIGAALSGYQLLVGHPGEYPVGPFGPYTDFIGPRFATVTLMGALDHRRRTGEGCCLDLSQVEAGVCFLLPELLKTQVTGAEPELLGNRHRLMCPHGVFRARGDDQWIAIAVRDDGDWMQVASLLDADALASIGDLTTLQARQRNIEALEQLLSDWVAIQDGARLADVLVEMNVPAALVSSTYEFVEDRQLIARGHFVRMARDDGSESVFENSRLALDQTPAQFPRTAPSYGRDNQYVLTELLGYNEAQVAALEAAGVLQ